MRDKIISWPEFYRERMLEKYGLLPEIKVAQVLLYLEEKTGVGSCVIEDIPKYWAEMAVEDYVRWRKEFAIAKLPRDLKKKID